MWAYRRRRVLSAWLCLLVICPAVPAASSQEQEVKVSFIYNFAKFIRWPLPSMPDKQISTDGQFHICTEGTQPLSGNIGLLQDRQIDGLKIVVRSIAKPDDHQGCNILFIADSEQSRLPQILRQVAVLPILTVSDMPGFAQDGGIIGMKVMDNRVRFDINLTASQKAGLVIDSQLLKLAVEVVK